MQWSRIKNIILILLALMNGFLLVLVVMREGPTARVQSETLSAAVQLLEKNGIHVDAQALPDEMTLDPCRLERDRDSERKMAVKLLGEVREEDRGGDVFRYVSTNGNGSIQFHSSGVFYALFSAGTQTAESGKLAEHAEKLMKSVGMDWTVIGQWESGGGTVLRLRQNCSGAPVYSCTADFRYENGALRSITNAKRLTGTPVVAESEETPLSLATVLIRFLYGANELGDVSSEIAKVEAGYTFSASLTGSGQLTPVWFVETETNRYEMNALTGEFFRLEDDAAA